MLKKAIAFFKKILRSIFNYKNAKNDSRYLKGINTSGNRKLKNGKHVRFLIWNLPAIVTCPYATESCKNKCYACKAERVYPEVLPCRYNNFLETKKDSFVENMIYTIETELSRPINTGKLLVVRIHESGDFYDKFYSMKWLAIASHFDTEEYHGRIVFMAYTKSIPFFRDVKIPDSMVVRASTWCDTAADLELESYENYPVYTAYTDEEIDEMRKSGIDFKEVENTSEKVGAEWLVCRCSDCGTCNACWNRKYKYVVCAIH